MANSSVPADKLFTKTHEWVLIQNDIATVGITDFAQSSLGDITFVELPEVGKDVQQSSEIGVIESVKVVSDIYSPLGGTITEVNHNAAEQPEIINQDCYETGWIFKLSITNKEEISTLLSPEEYVTLIEGDT